MNDNKNEAEILSRIPPLLTLSPNSENTSRTEFHKHKEAYSVVEEIGKSIDDGKEDVETLKERRKLGRPFNATLAPREEHQEDGASENVTMIEAVVSAADFDEKSHKAAGAAGMHKQAVAAAAAAADGEAVKGVSGKKIIKRLKCNGGEAEVEILEIEAGGELAKQQRQLENKILVPPLLKLKEEGEEEGEVKPERPGGDECAPRRVRVTTSGEPEPESTFLDRKREEIERNLQKWIQLSWRRKFSGGFEKREEEEMKGEEEKKRKKTASPSLSDCGSAKGKKDEEENERKEEEEKTRTNNNIEDVRADFKCDEPVTTVLLAVAATNDSKGQDSILLLNDAGESSLDSGMYTGSDHASSSSTVTPEDGGSMGGNNVSKQRAKRADAKRRTKSWLNSLSKYFGTRDPAEKNLLKRLRSGGQEEDKDEVPLIKNEPKEREGDLKELFENTNQREEEGSPAENEQEEASESDRAEIDMDRNESPVENGEGNVPEKDITSVAVPMSSESSSPVEEKKPEPLQKSASNQSIKVNPDFARQRKRSCEADTPEGRQLRRQLRRHTFGRVKHFVVMKGMKPPPQLLHQNRRTKSTADVTTMNLNRGVSSELHQQQHLYYSSLSPRCSAGMKNAPHYLLPRLGPASSSPGGGGGGSISLPASPLKSLSSVNNNNHINKTNVAAKDAGDDESGSPLLKPVDPLLARGPASPPLPCKTRDQWRVRVWMELNPSSVAEETSSSGDLIKLQLIHVCRPTCNYKRDLRGGFRSSVRSSSSEGFLREEEEGSGEGEEREEHEEVHRSRRQRSRQRQQRDLNQVLWYRFLGRYVGC